MRLSGVTVVFSMLCLCGAQVCLGGDYLYAPQPVTGDVGGEGVLVREVTVKKGDTLSKLSKQWSGRGHYYPQIMLFNEIKNPHRISLGQVIRVPISHTAEAQEHQIKSTKKRGKRHHQVKSVAMQADSKTLSAPAAKTPPSLSVGEKDAYDRAMASFRQGDCPVAIKLIDEFVVRYPDSPLLPEATLSRAECYLKLSTK